MKRVFVLSTLLFLLALSVAHADLEFSPFPMRTADPAMNGVIVIDETEPHVGSGILPLDTLVPVGFNVQTAPLVKVPDLEGDHGIMHEDGISSGGG